MANAQPHGSATAISCQTLPRHQLTELLDLKWGDGQAIFPEPYQNFDLPNKQHRKSPQSLSVLKYVSQDLQSAAAAMNPALTSRDYHLQSTHGEDFIENMQKELKDRSDIVQTEKSVFGFEGDISKDGSRENLLSMPQFAHWRRSTCTLEEGLQEIEQKLARTDVEKQVGILHVTQIAERGIVRPIPNSPGKKTTHVHQVMLLLFKTGTCLTRVVLFDPRRFTLKVKYEHFRAWTYAAMKYLGADQLYRLAGKQTWNNCCTIHCEALIRALMAGVEIKNQHCFQIQSMIKKTSSK